jgi:putative acyl-CoA dehydrogenase
VVDEVTNQTPPITGGNAWRGDPLLIQIAEDFAAPVRKDLDNLGRFVLSQEAHETARLANVEAPVLRTHDRQGRRIDTVDFHPAYHG